MTLEEIKNKVARKHGFASWNALITLHCGGEYRDTYVNEAAELYAKQHAIEFAEWADNETTQSEPGWWVTENGIITSKELYNTFKNR